ncbi:hypothetical protein HHI36_018307 [Cryptolaemus montrouzieri]|uniref:Angiotensin-converting enzyme n=1 Tax=Cryptolaemus montrouzieri TaxID=559131 RepID=A0ABD2P067_9CUCU
MWKFPSLLLLITILQISDFHLRRYASYDAYYLYEERNARRFIEIINEASAKDENKAQLAEWNYAANLTEENLRNKLLVLGEVAVRTKKRWMKLMSFQWKKFWDLDLKRQFKQYSVLGASALCREDLANYLKAVGEMEKIYSTNTICDFKDPTKCHLTMDKEIVDILKNSRNEPELKHIWTSWRNGIGPKVKGVFQNYVFLANKAARINKFANNAEMWLDRYEDYYIKLKFHSLWYQIQPLYFEIHAYTRYHLRKIYGNIVNERGPIPAHLLGNMWAQNWANVATDFLPFPNKPIADISENLRKQKYDAIKIFETAENFFISINMSTMLPSFWRNSILEKPIDREIICHGSAWDFADGKDFRIKMCTTITEENFVVAHHEMGHIEYYMQYKDQPFSFRSGANPGFHEAIGDMIALSVKSAKHLNELRLTEVNLSDQEAVLNSMFLMGMSKIVLLPFAYVVDQWRWAVFSGQITPENYNAKWWELRRSIQGIQPPSPRSEQDFDAASKYHVIADTPYIRYFVSFIIQFQFHKTLCLQSGEYNNNDPFKRLHLCDIYRKVKAGNLLKKMLALGSSRPWPEAMELLTGQREMDASALLEYFEPLYMWLRMENRKNRAFIGW